MFFIVVTVIYLLLIFLSIGFEWNLSLITLERPLLELFKESVRFA